MFTSRPNVIPVRPQLPTPVCPAQTRKLAVQLLRCQALDHVHHPCWRFSWRTTDEQVDVIHLYRQRFYLPIPRRTDLADHYIQSLGHFFPQHLPTIPRNPDEVICQTVYCMRASSCFHSQNYSMARSRGPHCAPHVAGRGDYRAAVPAFGGPAFLPTASGGVSSRRIS